MIFTKYRAKLWMPNNQLCRCTIYGTIWEIVHFTWAMMLCSIRQTNDTLAYYFANCTVKSCFNKKYFYYYTGIFSSTISKIISEPYYITFYINLIDVSFVLMLMKGQLQTWEINALCWCYNDLLQTLFENIILI